MADYASLIQGGFNNRAASGEIAMRTGTALMDNRTRTALALADLAERNRQARAEALFRAADSGGRMLADGMLENFRASREAQQAERDRLLRRDLSQQDIEFRRGEGEADRSAADSRYFAGLDAEAQRDRLTFDQRERLAGMADSRDREQFEAEQSAADRRFALSQGNEMLQGYWNRAQRDRETDKETATRLETAKISAAGGRPYLNAGDEMAAAQIKALSNDVARRTAGIPDQYGQTLPPLTGKARAGMLAALDMTLSTTRDPELRQAGEAIRAYLLDQQAAEAAQPKPGPGLMSRAWDQVTNPPAQPEVPMQSFMAGGFVPMSLGGRAPAPTSRPAMPPREPSVLNIQDMTRFYRPE